VLLRGDSRRRANIVAWPNFRRLETFVAEITYRYNSNQEDLQAIAEQYLFEPRAIMTVLLFSINYSTQNNLLASGTNPSKANFQIFKREVQNGTAKAVSSGPTTFRNRLGVVNPHKGLMLCFSDFFILQSGKDQAAYNRIIYISNQELSNALATAERIQANDNKIHEAYLRRLEIECEAKERAAI
jgi:spermidine/putrescine-binding protein